MISQTKNRFITFLLDYRMKGLGDSWDDAVLHLLEPDKYPSKASLSGRL